MGLSREARIITLLVIDSVFFFLEIIVGYAVGSLALVADSFHMLNDVMSLIVALYALKLSKSGNTANDPRYSYGWQRAEILGALINGVFLLALCFSIFMEAIERFVNVQEVSNPKLVIVVGSLGLASNIVGLFLFHDHGHSHGGHSHGGHGHSHSHGGHSHGAVKAHNGPHAHGDHDHSDGAHGHAHSHSQSAQAIPNGKQKKQINDADLSTSVGASQPHSRKDSAGSLYGHPAQTRAKVVQTAQDMGYDRSGKAPSIAGGERDRLLSRDSASGAEYGSTSERDIEAGTPRKSKKASANGSGLLGRKNVVHEEHREDNDNGDDDDDLPSVRTAIAHRLPGGKKSAGDDHGHSHGGGGGGHSHDGDMNMRGVFLHVLGDALGNVGVIGAGLIIMLTSYSWRFYSDPLISFIITIIIFHSALPLVKSASFILLQGVPATIPLESVREAIQNVPGVLSVHELHIWQLSESKIVASVHVLVDCSTGQEQRYMDIASETRALLHAWGIHSSTIQPEFVQGGIKEAARMSGVEFSEQETDSQGRLVTKDGKLVEHELSRAPSSCLLACEDESCAEAACCPPTAGQQQASSSSASSSSTSPHNHNH
ncbi:unnamed protein product [Sympodiomycopsis kandeliae]